MRIKMKHGGYVPQNKLKAEYERKWALYIKWCDTELLDPYNMETLARFDGAELYETPSGNIVIDEDVAFTEDGLAYDTRSTDYPREYLEKIDL